MHGNSSLYCHLMRSERCQHRGHGETCYDHACYIACYLGAHRRHCVSSAQQSLLHVHVSQACLLWATHYALLLSRGCGQLVSEQAHGVCLSWHVGDMPCPGHLCVTAYVWPVLRLSHSA